MSDQYIGEIRMFAGAYAPMDWEFCWGQTLNISAYQTLFAVIGTRYGGNGTTNFMLPDLRGRVPVGRGNGSGLAPRALGDKFGTETEALQPDQSSHGHSLIASTDATGSLDALTRTLGAVPAAGGNNLYTTGTAANVAMHASSVGSLGQGHAHNNMMPSLAINFIIAYNGEFPTQG
jgi:microcystin-dependent protein